MINYQTNLFDNTGTKKSTLLGRFQGKYLPRYAFYMTTLLSIQQPQPPPPPHSSQQPPADAQRQLPQGVEKSPWRFRELSSKEGFNVAKSGMCESQRPQCPPGWGQGKGRAGQGAWGSWQLCTPVRQRRARSQAWFRPVAKSSPWRCLDLEPGVRLPPSDTVGTTEGQPGGGFLSIHQVKY